jgi:phage shock protein A
MEQFLGRRWKYLAVRRSGRSATTADPKVELERAIGEADNRHRRLRGQAALVVANHKLTEARLDRAIEELERADSSARQAVLMAEIEGLMSLHLQASEAADQAKAAVAQSSAALRQRLGEQQKLLGQLDQAKMQPRIDEAMETLSEGIGHDLPSFDEVRERIEARYAQAKASAELVEGEQPA